MRKIFNLLSHSLSKQDLLRDITYRRLWSSILISSFGAQITMLALPLTAAILLNASATQMGTLTFMEIFPLVILSLPTGVWLDRVKKLPVYIIGQIMISICVTSVPVVYWLGLLNMTWLYVVGFIIGLINTLASTASQIILTQIVPRERLIEAHAKNTLATSGADIAGPATASILIKTFGPPFALLADATLLLTSAWILRGIHINETRGEHKHRKFWFDLKAGLSFVSNNSLLVTLALTAGGWQFCYNISLVVQILFATRELGLTEQAVGLSYMGMGIGTIVASVYGNQISRKIGPGPCLILGIVICSLGWGMLALAPKNNWSFLAFGFMLMCYSSGGVLIFINFLALRQAVTPETMLGRMTSTMRFLILIPAGFGALMGGWLGEHFSLRYAIGFASVAASMLAMLTALNPVIRGITVLPQVTRQEEIR